MMTPLPADSDGDALELYVTNDLPGEGNLMLRLSPELAEDVRALLDENGLEHSPAAEFSDGPQLVLETVQILGATAANLTALAAVIRTVVRRHDGRKIVIDGGRLEATGYSIHDVELLLEKQAKQQAALEAAQGKGGGDS